MNIKKVNEKNAMTNDNKQCCHQKESQQKAGVSNYVIIPMVLSAILCGWILVAPNSDQLN